MTVLILEMMQGGQCSLYSWCNAFSDKWPRTSSGFRSTSGTTASIAIIKNSKLYIGHVGDSGIALGFDDSGSEKFIRPKGTMLTVVCI